MNLSEEDKKQIEEEEAYRQKLRQEEEYRTQLREQSKTVSQPKNKGMGIGGCLVIIFIGFPILIAFWLMAVNPAKQMEKANKIAETYQKNNQSTFDVPSLVGKNLNGVIAVLGTPKGKDPTDLQIQLGAKEWDKTFVKDGTELLVTYRISDKKIVDFFIGTDDSSGATTDTVNLLALANAKENDPRYTIQFVATIGNPDAYTGIKIIPK